MVAVGGGLAVLAGLWHSQQPAVLMPSPARSLPPVAVRAAASAPVLDSLLPARQPRIKDASHAALPPLQLNSNVPGDVIKETMPSAKEGSPEAMRELAEALHECANANMASDDDIERLVTKRSLGRQLLNKKREIVSPEEDAAEVKRLETVRDSCLTIPADDTKQWVNWLEKSAASGDAQARFEYAWQALAEFPTQESQEENAEEYIRRRDLAFAYLQDSVANGDCSNPILNGFRKTSPDPVTRYVYEGLLLQHTLDEFGSGRFSPDYVNRESQSLTLYLNGLAYAVPIEQRGSAQATMRDILQNYCTQF